jgi:hypothetical protein
MSQHSSSSGDRFPIGVIIPTFNRSSALLESLRHLELQTHQAFEVVIVDDGSTDDTESRIAEYLEQTPLHVRYLRQANSGPARARNQAAAMLRSPVCLMLGDDIFASPALVETHLQLHVQRPEAEVVGLGYTRWSEAGQVVTPFMRWLDSSGIQFAYGDLLRGTPPTWQHFYTSNLSMKTEHLRKHPFHEGFHKAAMEDIELGYRLYQARALQIVFLPHAAAEHLHPTSVHQACRRMIGVGAAAYLFGQLWPEQKRSLSMGRIKKSLRSVAMEQRFVLPRLRSTAAILTQLWCPNPLLEKVLFLHGSFGYQQAAASFTSADIKPTTPQVCD